MTGPLHAGGLPPEMEDNTMPKTESQLSEQARDRIIESVLLLEFPDNPGAALGKHTMVRSAGPDWGRISEFDQRREELSDRKRCTDDKLVDILCDLRVDAAPAAVPPEKGRGPERTAVPKAKGARRFRFER